MSEAVEGRQINIYRAVIFPALIEHRHVIGMFHPERNIE